MKFTIEEGWLSSARISRSPNFSPRPPGVAVDLLIIHNISLPPGQFGGDCVEQFFCNQLDWNADPFFAGIRGLKVSSHLLIRRDGEVVQFVNFNDRAWHAGLSSFDGRDQCNDYSIGVELEGTDVQPYTEVQYRVLGALSCALLYQYRAISQRRIVGHCDVAPGRKTDPGASFDWPYYYSLLVREEEST